MTGNHPRVTVLMPVYNGERYLDDAIRSILTQSWHDFEFLIINDGSSDNTNRIAKEYAEAHENIHLLEFPRTGKSGILNKAMKLVESDIVRFLRKSVWL